MVPSFSWASGVGKDELAKPGRVPVWLEDALLSYDMSSMERHTAKLS